jgi:hypothetical protein
MSIIIDVAAEFTGKKAFKQAETATDKLTKSAKSLGKTLGISLGTAAILGYAKASVKAAADDQKAQKQLALALKNVGLARDAASAESFIQRLQSEFGIVDDKLRPAYQKLAIATHDTLETQKLLNLSLDISAATGKDLESVTSALSKAYLGSNTALSKLGVGISKADLKTKSFDDITSQLATTFKGAATESANTFAGSIAKLGVASQNVKEIIGTGIIDALKTLGEDTSVSNLASDMESVATSVADAIRGIGILLGELKKIPGIGAVGNILGFLYKASPVGMLADLGAQARRKSEVAAQKNPIQSGSYLNNTSVKTQKDILKVSKDSLKLAKAKAIFDLQKIQIEAALKGKLTDEERIRLKLMQAIADENVSAIEKYTKALDDAQAKTKALQADLDALKASQIPNPFADWSLTPLEEQLKWLDGYLTSFVGNAASAFATLSEAQKNLLGGYVPFVGSTPEAAKTGLTTPTPAVPSAAPIGESVGFNNHSGGIGGFGGQKALSINVNVGGSVISEGDLINSITNAIYQQQKNGKAITYNGTVI